MTSQTFHVNGHRLDRTSAVDLDDARGNRALGHRPHGLLRVGSTCLAIATVAVVLGALGANDVLLSVGALVGVIGAFLLACRELTGPQRVAVGPDPRPVSGRMDEHSVNAS